MSETVEIRLAENSIQVPYYHLPGPIDCKELLIYAPGLGCSGESAFGEVFATSPLGEEFSQLYFDYPSIGDLNLPNPLEVKLDNQSQILEQLIKYFQQKGYRIHLIAMSWSTPIALGMSSDTLTSLASLVSLDGTLLEEDVSAMKRWTSLSFEEFLEDRFPLIQRQAQKQANAYSLNTDPLALHQGATSLIETVVGREMLERLINLEIPRAYLIGAWDWENRPALGELWKRNVLCYEVPDAGHFMTTVNPKGFNELMPRVFSDLFPTD